MSAGLGYGAGPLAWARDRVTGHRPEPPRPAPPLDLSPEAEARRDAARSLQLDPALRDLADLISSGKSPLRAAQTLWGNR